VKVALRVTALLFARLREQAGADRVGLELPAGATVADAAAEIHKTIGATCHGARLWGPSARFDSQLVGREHMLQDGDTVEIVG